MALHLALAALCIAGSVSAVVSAVRGTTSRVRTVDGYDTRHPLP